jgi:hypothetical protein
MKTTDSLHSHQKQQNSHLFVKVLRDRKFLYIRLLILISLIISLILFIIGGFGLSCMASFVQNIVLVLISTSLLLNLIKPYSFLQRLKTGALAGAIFGSIPATLNILGGIVQYYFLGGMTNNYLSSGLSVPAFNIMTLWAGIGSQVVLWIMLVIVSSFSGIILVLLGKKE